VKYGTQGQGFILVAHPNPETENPKTTALTPLYPNIGYLNPKSGRRYRYLVPSLGASTFGKKFPENLQKITASLRLRKEEIDRASTMGPTFDTS
jgi:hypothetical protein